jgi:hypothetical protein
VTVSRTTATGLLEFAARHLWRAAVHEALTAGDSGAAGETGNGGEWKDRRLHDAKSRFEIMQTFSYLMLSSLAPASLCFKFKSQLGRLFRAQEVFVYLPLDNDMMPVSISSPYACVAIACPFLILKLGRIVAVSSQSERSATQVVMMEGAVLALSKTNTHPDVQLLPEEDTVLAVPIFLPDDVHEGSFSSIPFLHTKDSKEIYGCVEVSTLPMPRSHASISLRGAHAHAVCGTAAW